MAWGPGSGNRTALGTASASAAARAPLVPGAVVSGGIDLPDFGFEVGAFSDVGTEREHNEDSCGYHIESATSALIAVADGVSSSAGGETASRMAIEILLREYREQRTDLGIGRRLSRAIQRAKQFVQPVQLAELKSVVEVWVDAAMHLETRDLRMMSRLVKAQDKLMSASPEDLALEALYGEPEFRAVSNG